MCSSDLFPSHDSGGGGGSSSGSSWEKPDSPNDIGNESIGKNVTNVTTYTVPVGKRLYITSINLSSSIPLQIDGIEIAQGAIQDGATSDSLGCPIIVEAGSVVSSSSAGGYFGGYLVSNPTSLITPIIQTVDSIGGDYTVPSGKMFVLLSAEQNSLANMQFTPNGGSATSFGNGMTSGGSAWSLKQPMFFYEGDVINTASSTGSICGYEVNVGVQFGGII